MGVTVFEGASVVPMTSAEDRASVVAIKDDRIVFVGDRVPEEIASAPRVDLTGKCLLPAFWDCHLHFASMGLFGNRLDVRDCETIDQVLEASEAYARKDDIAVVMGFGLSEYGLREGRLPHREEMDRILPNRPLVLYKYDGHSAVANTAALKRFAVPLATRGYEGGESFEEKTGLLEAEAFYLAVEIAANCLSKKHLLQATINGSDLCLSKGVTAVHALEGVGFAEDRDVKDLLTAMPALDVKIYTYFQTLDPQKAVSLKLPRVGGCFEVAVDGCFGTRDAALLEPYEGSEDNRGIWFVDQERLDRYVLEAHRLGLQTAIHAIGDGAVETALTSIERALAAEPRKDHRHRIEHALLATDEQLDRIAEAGITIASQPAFSGMSLEPIEYLETLLGDRVERLLRHKAMLDRGIRVVGGSDAPVTPVDPIAGVHAACNHMNPDERVGTYEALEMFTCAGAQAVFREQEAGTLAEGKLADLVVLDADPLETPTEKLGELRVEQVWADGKRWEKKEVGMLGFGLRLAGKALGRLFGAPDRR